MELRQLEHFIAVAEEGQFTRAARRVHLVQSSLSASIQALERELGTTLLHRTPRGVALTEAGCSLLPEARRTLAAAAAGREAVDAVRGLVRGTLVIGYIQATASVDLPALVARLRADHPGVTVALRTAGAPQLIEALIDGELDLAITDLPGAARGIRTIALGADAIVLATAADHPLARRQNVALAELDDTDFVEYQPRSGLRAMLDRACRDAGLRRRVVCETDTIAMLLDCVAEQIGVALIPETLVADDDRLAALTITPEIPRQITLALPAERAPTPAAAAFLATLGTRADDSPA